MDPDIETEEEHEETQLFPTTEQPEENPAKNYRINYGYLCIYTVAMIISQFQYGYILAANNQVASVLNRQLGITKKEDQDFFNTLIASAPVFGACFGSLIGANMINIGRRKTVMVTNLITVAATLITLAENVYFICFGRMILGACGAIANVAVPRFIEETVPSNEIGVFGSSINTANNFGSMVSMLMGLGLPATLAQEQQSNVQFWKVIYGLPIIFACVQLLLLGTLFKHDSIRFLVQQSKKREALTMISRVYRRGQDPQEIYDEIVKGVQPEIKNYQKLLADCKQTEESQNRATFICMGLMAFNQFTGVTAIMLFSNHILKQIDSSENFQITPREGTYLLGVVNFIGCVTSIIPIKHFGRRTILMFGQLTMALLLLTTGFFEVHSQAIVVICLILAHLFVFQNTQGPIVWIYASEVVAEGSLGMCILTSSVVSLFVTLSTGSIMQVFGAQGVFWLFGILTLIGGVFVKLYIVETSGLSAIQKKKVFAIKKDF